MPPLSRRIGLTSDSDHLDSSLPVKGAQLSQPIAFSVPPHARFVAPDAAVVSWETTEPCESIIEYGVGEKWDRQVREPGSETVHRITLRGLEPKARYQYRIRDRRHPIKAALVSEAFELDNALNYAVAGVPDATSPYGSDTSSRKCRASCRTDPFCKRRHSGILPRPRLQ